LVDENEELRRRLDEAQETLRALQAGEADAIVVEADVERVFTLESADKAYWLLVTQVPNAAAALTSNGAIISCNRRFADLLMRPLPSLVHEPISRFVTAEGQAVLVGLLQEGLAGEAQAEVPLLMADGSAKEAFLGVCALREGALGLCLMVTDLSEQRHYQELKRAQEALRASEEQLRDADRRKDEFLATLAHELRNPLAPMRHAVEILKTINPAHPRQDMALAVLDRQVHVMTRLLEDLLDVSRISRRRLELRPERVALTSILEAALEISGPVIDAARHELTVRLPSEPVALEADPLRLAQVFANVLNNAAKYTDEGGSIQLTARREGQEVIVSVEDSGVGIANDMLGRIFDMFSQARPEHDSSQGGLGIGLSLAKGLVELHGGSIEAHSGGPGRGSQFVVRLPVAADL
jgi:signal transduction histidine kinase